MIEIALGKELKAYCQTSTDEYSNIPYDSWRELDQKAQLPGKFFIKDGGNGYADIWYDPIVPSPYKGYFEDPAYNPFRKFLADKYFNKIDNFYNDNKKESNEMNIMSNVNFDFGPAGDGIRVSPFGLAITNSKGQWVTYDAKNDKIVDVTGFTFDFGKMIYKMPVAVKDIKPGDLIVHQNRAMYVQEIEDGNIYTVDILAAEKKNVLPVTNIFNFNFVTKVVSLMNFDMGTPSPDQPFGNIMPIMMMSALMGDGKNDFFDQMDMGKMMLMSAMMGGQNPLANMFNGLTGIMQNPTT